MSDKKKCLVCGEEEIIDGLDECLQCLGKHVNRLREEFIKTLPRSQLRSFMELEEVRNSYESIKAIDLPLIANF